MQKAKITEVLKSFSIAEMRDLAIYVERTKAKGNTYAYQLFILLNKNYPDFSGKNLDKEKVFKKLFGDKKYDDNKLAKIMSELTKLIEEFIISTESKTNVLQNKILLLQFYDNHNLDKYYKQTEKEISELFNHSTLTYFHGYLKYIFETVRLRNTIKYDKRNPNYQSLYEKLNEFYSIEKLRWENLAKVNNTPSLAYQNNDTVLFTILNKTKILIEKNEESIFLEIATIIKDNLNLFDDLIANDIIWILIAYSIQQQNLGNSLYYEHMIYLYDLLIKRNLILNIHNIMNIGTYKNYITVCLKVNKIKEADAFLEKFKPNLKDEIRENVYHFNKALIEFEKKNYKIVLTLILYCKFSDVYYKLNQRRIIIKTYFELLKTDENYYTSLTDAITAFNKYLLITKSLPELHVEMNKNFLKLLIRIVEFNTKKTEKKITLIELLSSFKHITEKMWLEQKINQLE